jgi:hypothetical protein
MVHANYSELLSLCRHFLTEHAIAFPRAAAAKEMSGWRGTLFIGELQGRNRDDTLAELTAMRLRRALASQTGMTRTSILSTAASNQFTRHSLDSLPQFDLRLSGCFFKISAHGTGSVWPTQRCFNRFEI